MGTITVTIKGGAAVAAKLKNLGSRLYEMRDEFEDVGKEMASYYGNEVFNSQGGVYGDRWQSLSTATLKYKTSHLGGQLAGASAAQPLVRSGAMKAGFKFEASRASVRVYNDVESQSGYNYFQAHQLGLGHVPQRLMIGLNKELERRIADKIKVGIEKKLASA